MSDLCAWTSADATGICVLQSSVHCVLDGIFYYLFPEKRVFYADDTSLLSYANLFENFIRRKAKVWFNYNSLKLNVDKTQKNIFPTKINYTEMDAV